MAKNRSKPVEEDSDGDSFFDEDDSYDFDDEDNCDLNEDTTSADKPVHSQPAKISKRLLQLKERLGLDDLKKKVTETERPSTTPVTNSGKEPLVVVYEDPRKRKKAKKPLPAVKAVKPVKESLCGPEFNINKAKHEVRRLTISAIKGKASKEEAKAALAISLGALPAKKKPVNYKVLQQMKKKEAEEIAKQKEREQVFIKRVATMTKKKDHKNKNKVINFDGKFGKLSGKNAKKRS